METPRLSFSQCDVDKDELETFLQIRKKIMNQFDQIKINAEHVRVNDNLMKRLSKTEIWTSCMLDDWEMDIFPLKLKIFLKIVGKVMHIESRFDYTDIISDLQLALFRAIPVDKNLEKAIANLEEILTNPPHKRSKKRSHSGQKSPESIEEEAVDTLVKLIQIRVGHLFDVPVHKPSGETVVSIPAEPKVHGSMKAEEA
jgi:hypothetical protein